VSFGIGGSRWCLPVAEVVQIVRHENVRDLPHAQPPVAGVITLHGDVVPVVDLHGRLEPGTAASPPAVAGKQRILVARIAGRQYGILVDEVRELVDLDEATGIETGTGRPAAILDLARAMGEGGA
jgi:purine-binding chemotaxis protein CheW